MDVPVAARLHNQMTTASDIASDFSSFAIGFDHRDRGRLHELIDQILDSERWTEAELVRRFESTWEEWNDAPAPPWPCPVGPAGPWRRSRSQRSQAPPCCARPTPSWPRRWPRSTPGPPSSSSTATGTTC